MPSHQWGDDWFKQHGNKLYKAIDYCMDTWLKYGRIGSHGKEKYGTFRDHVRFYSAWTAIHCLIRPSHVYYSWGKTLFNIDLFLGKIVRLLRINKLIVSWQKIVYNYAVQQACKKYPEVIDEIVADLDGYELIKPGIFGKVDGTKIHHKYWTRI